jgi:hypothetical protein
MNPTTGAMVKEVGTFNIPGSGDFLFDLRFDPTGRFLYVAEGEINAIDAFISNPTTGALTQVRGSPFVPRGSAPGTCNPRADFCGGAVSISAKHRLYYVSSTFDGVSEFAINPTTGALTRVTGSPFKVPGQDGFMDIDETGRFLYTGNENTITGFHINATTGVLTPVPGSPYSASGNTGLTICALIAPFFTRFSDLTRTRVELFFPLGKRVYASLFQPSGGGVCVPLCALW